MNTRLKMVASLLGFLVLPFASVNAFAASAESKGSDVANIFITTSKKVIPSVVNIFTTSTIKQPWMGRGGGEGGPDDLWRRFFEDFFGEPFEGTAPQGAQKAQSLGSGFIIETTSTGGLILTNNHVIEGADEVKVKFTEAVEETETPAEIIGHDPDLDIALLKVKTKRKLEAVKLSDSDKLEVGEWIAALGNPFGHGHSVTHGIISAKERTLPGGFGKYLQVDAPINPGNSGGPLVNLDGEVVGINNAIDARGPGIGFAIPINQVKNILPQLKKKGHVERGYIGVSVDELRPDLARSLKLDESLKAPIITNVLPGLPGDKAGLKPYDVVLEVDGKTVKTPSDLVDLITSKPIGSKVQLKINRGGHTKSVEVTVAKRPDLKENKSNGRRGRRGGKSSKPGVPKINTGMLLSDIDEDVARELGLPENYQGIVVEQITPGGPAYLAGLRRGDVILEVDKKPVKSVEGFYKIVHAKKDYNMRVRKQDEAGNEQFVMTVLKLAPPKEE